MSSSKRQVLSMRSAVTEIGDTSIRLVSDSGEINIGDQKTMVLIYGGLYDALDTFCGALERSGAITGYDGWSVDNLTLRHGKGNTGRLTIHMVPSQCWYGSEGTKKRETVEIEMAEVERPLLTHPTLNDGESNYMAIHLGKWMESTPEQKVLFQYTDAAGLETLTDTEIVWAQKILKGVESFLDFVPVITRTSIYSGPFSTSAAGKRESPPISVSGYANYLKTADRIIQTAERLWTRTEQWTGSRAGWDTDMYEAAT